MRKILLVDDDSAYTWCLQKYLQNRGYRVKTANTLEEARIAIKEEIPLLICCDLGLPDGSGLELLDMVRAAYGTLPFILASCHEKEDYEKEAMRRGATLCVDKLEAGYMLTAYKAHFHKSLFFISRQGREFWTVELPSQSSME